MAKKKKAKKTKKKAKVCPTCGKPIAICGCE